VPPFANVFSWSKSRDEQFRECPRRYYYDKYASWGGWDASAPAEARMAYILKNLKNRWAWKGETVHHVLEDVMKALRLGQVLPKEEALARLTESMRRDYRSSKAKKYLEDPKNRVGLFEHEYEKPVGDAVWKKIHDEAAGCVEHFFGARLYGELKSDDKKNWLAIEDLEEFECCGAKTYVKLDFARKKDGVIEIYDWKTGKTDKEASVQMGAYAIYATEKWRTGLGNIRAFLFNVSEESPSVREQVLSEQLIEDTRKFIAESIAGMKALLADPDKNIPKPESEFPYAANEKLCSFCSFYKICKKYTGGAAC